MPYLAVRGLEFFYESFGDPAAAPLLILSGFTDYTDKCAWQAADLATNFYVITFDNRGAGRSGQPKTGYTIADMADDTAGVLEALAIPSAYVFGFSMGGMIALELVLRHPQLVRRLAVGCTSAGGRLLVLPEQRVIERLASPVSTGDRRRDFYEGLWVSIGDEFRAGYPEVIDRLAELALSNPQTPLGYQGQVHALRLHDVADRLGEIQAPTLVMHGERDRFVPVENGRLLAQHIPGARLIIYADAGHLFFVEEAAAVNHDLQRFLTQP